MERRDFLKVTCSLCALASAGLMMGSLTSCSNLPIYKTAVNENKISVPISLFAQTDFQIVRPHTFDYDIALQREKDGTYTAILLCCTHADNQVSSTGNGFVCSLHGSRFDKEGNVLKGPAERSLKKYKTQVIGGNVVIML